MNEKQKTALHPFTALLRAYEEAHEELKAYDINPYADDEEKTARRNRIKEEVKEHHAQALLALAKACASSVVKKCLDPQRKTAGEKQVNADGRTDTTQEDKPHKLTGSTNKAMEDLRIGIVADIALLENLHTAINNATAFHYNADGDYIREIVDHDAEDAVNAIIGDTLSDGIDLVHTAIVAILEQTEEHSGSENWLEKPYIHRVLSKKVYIKNEDSAHWKEEETTPIREVYRAIRRAIQNSKAVQADPKNGYLYIEDTAHDPETGALETIYHRLSKWSDLGGNDCNGNYTADMQTVADYEKTLALLNLTDRQARIIMLRMQGYGYKAIATYLGVSYQAVQNALSKVKNKCELIGFTPNMWKEMSE